MFPLRVNSAGNFSGYLQIPFERLLLAKSSQAEADDQHHKAINDTLGRVHNAVLENKCSGNECKDDCATQPS